MSSGKHRHPIKRIAIDVAGFGLIIASPFLGLFPGPGGVPIFLAGLGLLASNHDWAHKILSDLEQHRESLSKKFFANPTVSLLTDVIGAILLAVFAYGLVTLDNPIQKGLCVGGLSTTLLIVLSNKSRIDRIQAKWRSRKRKH